jgi:uncharacterized protein YidB (DUF937 family)
MNMARGLNMGSAGIALLGLLAVKGFQNRDQLGKMLGDLTGPNGAAGNVGGVNAGGGLGGMLGGLGDLLNGNNGASRGNVLNEGLGGLLDRFKQNGQADTADSWVKSGPNRAVEASQLETALGEDVIEHLQEQTGLSRNELLQRLSTNLPQTVDQLTPDGRVPTAEETSNWRF